MIPWMFLPFVSLSKINLPASVDLLIKPISFQYVLYPKTLAKCGPVPPNNTESLKLPDDELLDFMNISLPKASDICIYRLYDHREKCRYLEAWTGGTVPPFRMPLRTVLKGDPLLATVHSYGFNSTQIVMEGELLWDLTPTNTGMYSSADVLMGKKSKWVRGKNLAFKFINLISPFKGDFGPEFRSLNLTSPSSPDEVSYFCIYSSLTVLSAVGESLR